MHETVLVLDDLYASVHIINEVKKLGIRPVQVVFDEDQDKLSKNKIYCSRNYFDAFKKITSFLEENELKPIAIINPNDRLIHFAAVLIQHFDLRGNSVESVKAISDKYNLHVTCRELGLESHRPTTKKIKLKELSQLQIQREYIAKPIRGVHSKGIQQLKNQSDLQAFEEFVSKQTNLFTNGVLLEEFIYGEQITCTCFYDNQGKLHTIQYVYVLNGQDLQEGHSQLVYRTTINEIDEVVRLQIERILSTIGKYAHLNSCIIHPEFIVRKDQVYLIEVNLRVGGFRQEMTMYSLGINLRLLELELSLGLPTSIKKKFRRSCTGVELWAKQTGVLRKLHIPKSDKLMDVRIKTEIGEKYVSPPDGNTALAKFYVVDDKDSLNLAKEFREQCVFVIE